MVKYVQTMNPWLRFFRVVNLPTVPGDVLVGAAAAGAAADSRVWGACAASCFLYLFGLAHNDIVGAQKDKGRPIPDGEISMDAAWAAAAACLAAAFGIAWWAGLPAAWWWLAVELVVLIVLYNRTKAWWLMGMCRAWNVLCGAALAGVGPRAVGAAVLWWLYISLVTLYSEGEERDPAKKRRVGMLVGGIVYLQLAALAVFPNATYLAAGAALLALLWIVKRQLPKVSAS